MEQENRIVTLITSFKSDLLKRLDLMDSERNESRKTQTAQREQRLIEVTQIKATVKSLSERFGILEQDRVSVVSLLESFSKLEKRLNKAG